MINCLYVFCSIGSTADGATHITPLSPETSVYHSDTLFHLLSSSRNPLNKQVVVVGQEDRFEADMMNIFRNCEYALHKLVWCVLISNTVSIPATWFSSASITSQIQSYKCSLTTAASSTRNQVDYDFVNVVRRNVAPLFSSIRNLGSHWTSTAMLHTVTSSVKAIRHVEEGLEKFHAVQRNVRMSVMLGHLVSWTWLESLCAYYSQEHVTSGHMPDTNIWAWKLARHIRLWFDNRQTQATVSPSHYIASLPATQDTFILIGGRNEYFVTFSEAAKQQRVYSQMKIILQRWLGFSTVRYADGQTWILDNLTSALGFGVLFLDKTWNIYSHFPTRVLGRNPRDIRHVYLHQLIPFVYRLQACDAANNSSSAHSGLREFEQLYSTQSVSSILPLHMPLSYADTQHTASIGIHSHTLMEVDAISAPSPMTYGAAMSGSDAISSFESALQSGESFYGAAIMPASPSPVAPSPIEESPGEMPSVCSRPVSMKSTDIDKLYLLTSPLPTHRV